MVDCLYCGKPCDTFFIIADDMENPRPYHKKCLREMLLDIWLRELEKK